MTLIEHGRPIAAGPAPTATHYGQFLQLAKARITELGVSYEVLDHVCGFPQRYLATLLCGNKSMSVFSLFTLCSALGYRLELHHDEAALTALKQRADWTGLRRAGSRFRPKNRAGAVRFTNYVDFYKQIGRKGAIAMHTRRKLRSAAGRKAVMARWRRHRSRARQNGHSAPSPTRRSP